MSMVFVEDDMYTNLITWSSAKCDTIILID